MLTKIAVLFLALTIFFTGCERKAHKQEAQKKEQNQQQTQIEEKEANKSVEQSSIVLHTTGGLQITLRATPKGIVFEGYEGKIVLLNFFATWCPPCRAEIPHLADIQNAFKDDLQIIGVLMEDNKEDITIQKFEKLMQINYPIANSPENFLLSDALGGIKSLPTTVMYDKRGNYFTHYVGAVPQEMIEADIQRALAIK